MIINSIFLSGKILGSNLSNVIYDFDNVEVTLSLFGIKEDDGVEYGFNNVVIPLFLPKFKIGISKWRQRKIRMKALKNCDATYMMNHWEKSSICRRELKWAKKNGLKIFFQFNG